MNLRPTFPSGGIDITDMISEFENEAFVGFQEIFCRGSLRPVSRCGMGPPGPNTAPWDEKVRFLSVNCDIMSATCVS